MVNTHLRAIIFLQKIALGFLGYLSSNWLQNIIKSCGWAINTLGYWDEEDKDVQYGDPDFDCGGYSIAQ